jgi:GPH family glycoside/pentoside/hexuronide:cation symporter
LPWSTTEAQESIETDDRFVELKEVAAEARANVIDAPPLSRATRLWFGLGQAAEGIKNYAFANFLLFYYTQVLGLSGKYAGAAIFIALIFDAVSDPLTGVLSDRLKSRWGRRHPFIYAAALPLGVAFYFTFAPPQELSQLELFAWLAVMATLTRSAMTLYHVPHISLGAELSTDYIERTRIVQLRSIGSILGNSLCVVLGMYYYFAPTAEFPNGQLNPAVYPEMAAVFSVVMFVVIIASGLGTHNRIPHLADPDPSASEFGVLKSLARDMTELFRLPSFRSLFFGSTLSFIAFGVSGALGLYTGTYFWKLTTEQMLIGMSFNAIGIFLGFLFWPRVAVEMDKKPTYITGFVIFLLFVSVPVLLKVAGFYPAHESPAYLPLYYSTMMLWAFGISASMILGGSMMADVTDEDELRNDRRREGVFFGANSFSAKSSVGVGSLIAGFVVDAVGLEQGMTPEQVTPAMQSDLGLAVGLSLLVLVAMGIGFFARYPLNRRISAEIRARLDAGTDARGVLIRPAD